MSDVEKDALDIQADLKSLAYYEGDVLARAALKLIEALTAEVRRWQSLFDEKHILLLAEKAKLAKAVEALQAFKAFDEMPTRYKRPDVFEVSVRRKLLSTLAEIEGEKT